MMFNYIKKIAVIAPLIVVPLFGTIINVPGEQPTIQAGINAATGNDTVLVAAGTYQENIHFREKGLVVASHYIIDPDPMIIEQTIIDGSNPANPDTGSCVLIVSDSAYTTADTSAALIGFTITGGTGTKWLDEHGAGLYREGGGVLIQYLSPRLRHNIIRDNHITDQTGVTSTGGGAIRCGDGNPDIANNVIAFNSALYGGGIVLNYTGAHVRNNVIAHNSAGDAYGGGGGLWILENATHPKILNNNTIVYNSPGQYANGGGIRFWAASATLRNNIIWDNEIAQILQTGGVVLITYSDIQGGHVGEGNINADPLFTAQNLYLSTNSPCIDAGDTSIVYNDPEDTLNPGSALWPSLGLLRNDMGAYGGPGRTILPDVPSLIEEGKTQQLPKERILLESYPNPFERHMNIRYQVPNGHSTVRLMVYDIAGRRVRDLTDKLPGTVQEASVLWDGRDDKGNILSSGVYICTITTDKGNKNRQVTLLRE